MVLHFLQVNYIFFLSCDFWGEIWLEHFCEVHPLRSGWIPFLRNLLLIFKDETFRLNRHFGRSDWVFSRGYCLYFSVIMMFVKTILSINTK